MDRIIESDLMARFVGGMCVLASLLLLFGVTIWSFKWVLSLLFGI